MTDEVEGTAALPWTTMCNRGVQFGEPSLFPLVDGVGVLFRSTARQKGYSG